MKILVSLDGTDFSRAAVEKCRQIIAAPEKTAVRIVSAFEVVEPLDISISPEFSRELEGSAREKAQKTADETAALIREDFPNIDLTVEVMRGASDRILIELAQNWQADLIIVGSHGQGFWGRMLLGSITDSLVHHAPCSVLVARRAEHERVVEKQTEFGG